MPSDNHPPRRSYKLGTVKLYSDGIPKVKTREGWIAEHRVIMQHLIGRDLGPGEKVYHLDNTLRGEDGYNDRTNLAKIKHRTTKWKPIRARILKEPKEDKTRFREYVPR